MRKLALALTLAAGCASASSETVKQDAAVKVVTAQVLPALKGDKLKATVLEVSYPPGGASSAHRHPCPVIGYILEGRYRTQVEGGPVTDLPAGRLVLRAGQRGPPGVRQRQHDGTGPVPRLLPVR